MADEINLSITANGGIGLAVNDAGSYVFTDSAYVPMHIVTDDYEGPYTVTPTGEQQTLETNDLHMVDDVTIEAAPLESKSVTVNAAGSSTISPSTGYYGISGVDLTVPQGKISMQRPTMDNASGEVRSRANVTAGYVATGGTYTSSALTLDKQAAKTVTPSESAQVAVEQYRWTTGEVDVAAIPSSYVGSGVTRRDSTDLSASGATVTAPAGYYDEDGTVSVGTGSEGTPVATKGTVSGNSVSITPTVTNIAGYVTGGTHTGTPVTVTASELVSGTKSITANDTGIDVTEYAAVDVAVPTGTPRTSTDLIVSGATVTTPAGLYYEAASATVQSGSATMPSSASGNGTIVGALNNTMNVQGTITATPQVSAGYVSSGTSGSTSVSLQTSVTTKNATTYNPQASDREIAAGTYLIGKQTIKGAPLQSKSVTTNGSVTPDSGYYGLSDVTVNVSGGAPNLQAKTGITPGTSSQTVTADAGYDGLSSVQIDAVPTAVPFVGIENAEFYTDTFNRRMWRFTPFVEVDESAGDTAGYIADGAHIQGENYEQVAVQSGTTVTPTESQQTIGGTGQMLEGAVTVGAISSTYVGSGITRRDSTDLSASGAVVSVPSGYYENSESKAVASGSATVPATINAGNGASISYGTTNITLSKANVSITPTVTPGYVSSGTAGNATVYLSATADFQPETTFHPSTSDQTIVAGKILQGPQRFKAVTLANLTAENIKNGVTVKVGDSSDDDCVTSVTGTYTGGGGGSVQFDTKTASGGSTYPVSLQFTGMKGEPKAFVCRLNAQVSSSGSTTYYYIVDICAFGTTTHGNCFRIGSTRRVDNITSGYSWSYSGTTLTITSSAASRSASPGAFYSGSYELLYCY